MQAKSVGSLTAHRLQRPKNWRLLPENPGDPESFKIRRGKIGGNLDYFGPEDVSYAATAMNGLDPAPGYVAVPHS